LLLTTKIALSAHLSHITPSANTYREIVNEQTVNRVAKKKEGLRERKRQETLQRIAETGLKLFVANGYEATTLEAVAAAAGISRRTFFHYFKSKEELLLAWQGTGFEQALRPAIMEEFPDQNPLDAALNCLLKLVSRYETDESIIVDRLLRSTEALRARKQAVYVDIEQALLGAMCELWPEPKRRASLRIVAMVSIGAMRLAVETWRQENGKRSLAKYLRESFATLKAEI
jgi:AcrR family transcriptional regulator